MQYYQSRLLCCFLTMYIIMPVYGKYDKLFDLNMIELIFKYNCFCVDVD